MARCSLAEGQRTDQVAIVEVVVDCGRCLRRRSKAEFKWLRTIVHGTARALGHHPPVAELYGHRAYSQP
jgi:hypothetical protein